MATERITEDGGRAVHPAQKPVELMEILVGCVPMSAIDPYMGTGTTGVACVRLGRKFIGVEIERKYFDTACRRIEAAYADRSSPLFGEVAPVPVQQLLPISP